MGPDGAQQLPQTSLDLAARALNRRRAALVVFVSFSVMSCAIVLLPFAGFLALIIGTIMHRGIHYSPEDPESTDERHIRHHKTSQYGYKQTVDNPEISNPSLRLEGSPRGEYAAGGSQQKDKPIGTGEQKCRQDSTSHICGHSHHHDISSLHRAGGGIPKRIQHSPGLTFLIKCVTFESRITRRR